jgi:hypothetical protein
MTRARLKAPAPLVAFAILSVIAVGALFAYTNRASAEPAASVEYAEYRNDRWHYSLAVPADMTATEFEREGGGQTVQFMDATGDKELIISAWPYTQLDLTLAREGTPSTNADQPDHLEIVNVIRDGVFKVVFTKNGTLYVVTTLLDDEGWLTDLLTSWRFID